MSPSSVVVTHITTFMTRFPFRRQEHQRADARSFPAPMVADGLLRIAEGELQLTKAGRPLLPHAAVFFPQRRRTKQADRAKVR